MISPRLIFAISKMQLCLFSDRNRVDISSFVTQMVLGFRAWVHVDASSYRRDGSNS